MARRITSGRFSRGPRRNTDWSASAPQSAPTAVAAGAVALLETFTPIAGGETVIRTRGLFGWQSDQTAASENQVGAFGIGVVSAQAESVGITAIPHPATDAAWGGWLYHQFYGSRLDSLSSIGFSSEAVHRVMVDSKAMRKIGDEERLVVVIENLGQGVTVYDSFRFLSKLH